MILIADSGSTKCDWAFLKSDKSEDIRFQTEGINPFFCDADKIESIIKNDLQKEIDFSCVEKLFFFGAGCRAEKTDFMKSIFVKFFPSAEITIDSDMKAAAIALFGDSDGIACIIGTGSASCLYHDNKLSCSIPSLGYILGDEGSGAVLGKKLLGDCFKNQMPLEIEERFIEQYHIDIPELLNRVYHEAFPNRFLASFTPFLSENLSNPYIYNLVFDSFLEFIYRNVSQYPDYKNYTVSFCGSVAYYLADALEIAAYETGINFGTIIKSPMDNMVEYFREKYL